MDGMIEESNIYIQHMEDKISDYIIRRNSDYKQRKSTIDQLRKDEVSQE